MIVMGERVRARSDERHLASEHIKELRHLVDARTTKKSPDPSDPGIETLGLHNRRTVFHDGHCPELENRKLLGIKSVPSLPEENRAARIELDRNRTHYYHWRKYDRCNRCTRDI